MVVGLLLGVREGRGRAWRGVEGQGRSWKGVEGGWRGRWHLVDEVVELLVVNGGYGAVVISRLHGLEGRLHLDLLLCIVAVELDGLA